MGLRQELGRSSGTTGRPATFPDVSCSAGEHAVIAEKERRIDDVLLFCL